MKQMKRMKEKAEERGFSRASAQVRIQMLVLKQHLTHELSALSKFNWENHIYYIYT